MARRIRQTIGPLDARQQAVLRAVIEEYVASAVPVGSATVVDRYRLGVSSATIRNVLAELEVAGYLTHPYTSAGRIPTDTGYRYYVESIIDAIPLPAVDQLLIRHQFGQVEYANEQWFRLAATTIAAATRAAGLATPAKPEASRARRIDVVHIADRLASLIVVLQEGTIRQVLVSTDAAYDDDTLTRVAGRLSDLAACRISPPAGPPPSSSDRSRGWMRTARTSPTRPSSPGSARRSCACSASPTPRPSPTSSAMACST